MSTPISRVDPRVPRLGLSVLISPIRVGGPGDPSLDEESFGPVIPCTDRQPTFACQLRSSAFVERAGIVVSRYIGLAVHDEAIALETRPDMWAITWLGPRSVA